MTDIRKLIDEIADTQARLYNTQFLAPCFRGGRICARVAGIVYNFTHQPSEFEGWGIFQPVGEKTAKVVKEADLPQIDKYMQQFPQIRLRLARQLRFKSWLAYPVNEADMRQRLKVVKPTTVHLVTEGVVFEQIIARWNGQFCWFEELDRRSDPTIAENLQSALKQFTPVEELHFKDITPEIRSCYQLAGGCIEPADEKRLRRALQMGGGSLKKFQDRGDYWIVDWTTADGVCHTSAIAKTDLTVISTGICLSGRDRDFDLQSLVGVVEQQ
jgi:hypothetical protein